MGSHTTVALGCHLEETVKGSRFLAFAFPISTPDSAAENVNELRAKYPTATHVCWAYRIGPEYRFSDDGEPAGTAGAPMYRVLEGSGLDCVLVAVVRYFGGVKLGAGGLVRAYAGVVRALLQAADRVEVHVWCRVRVEVPFEWIHAVYRLGKMFSVVFREEIYHAAEVHCVLEVMEKDQAELEAVLRDWTRGRAVCVLETAEG